MSSNGKYALSGDSSSEKPKGVQAESYSGPINPIDTPCISSSHSIGEPYSKQAKVVVSVSSAVRCLINGKLKNGGVRILRRSWSYTMCSNLISRVSLFQPLLLDPKMRAAARTQIDDPSLYHITVQKKSETSEENQKKKKSKIREGN
ncbi:BnaAnng31690D, partial [Brassica napus]